MMPCWRKIKRHKYEDIKNAPDTEYGVVTKETLWKNLEYFLKAVVPEAEKIGMKLAMHPDEASATISKFSGFTRIAVVEPPYCAP